MFRPVFKHSLRQGVVAATRKYTSGPVAARSLPRARFASGLAAGAGFVCAMYAVQNNAVSNEIDEEKVKAEQLIALNSAEPEKTAFELAEEAKKEVETLEAVEVPEPSAEPSAETVAESSENPENGSQSAAFNPETGEINWDCPCLGGMAHGPCGEEFKAAFACFVYSETEPKGIDCIGKFEAMRTCFRQHPEHYKEELYEDDEDVPSTGASHSEQAASGEKTTTLKDVADEVAKETPATEDIAKVA